jgi:aerobic carbon-monoxide dehydrogenase large subunit
VTAVLGNTVMGTRVLRKEDPALLTGESRFTDDLTVAGALHVRIVRSPVAHARIRSIDATAARAHPGVVAVLTGPDLQGEFANPLPCAWPVTEDMKHPAHWPLALDEVRYVGDGVAAVVAETREAARDAAERVIVDYEDLPVVLDLEDARSDRVLVHSDLGTNRCYTWDLIPDLSAVDAAFAAAAHTVKKRYVQQRLIAMAMEPRSVVVVPAPFGGDFTMYSATQVPHFLKIFMAIVTGTPEQRIRVIAPAVGGGFGSKLDIYAEEALCLVLAKRLGRPVRWNEDRSENAQATVQGRGMIQDIELAADADGRITAVRVRLLADMGAYLQLVTPGVPLLGAFLYHGVYDIPAYSFSCTSVFTNRTPTDAYRGAGRPEATYAIERAIDALAAQINVDPAELRRRNYIRKEQFPFSSPAGLVFDSGDYEPALDRALEMVGYDALRAEQRKRRKAGARTHLGVGISTYVEMCGLAPSRVLASLRYVGGGWEAATVRVLPTGTVQVVTGTTPHGQAHETSWAMIVADALGIGIDDIEVLCGDTAIAPHGLDTYGSRSASVGGTAVHLAAHQVLDKARAIAAHQLEAAEADLEYVDGGFRVKGTPARSLALAAIAFEAFTNHDLPDGMDPGLEAQVLWDPPNFTFPFGVHVAVVEVDAETGEVSLVRYVAVDDCGNQINPVVVEGQVHGGIVQGVAQALWEEAVYDDEGQLLTSSLLDYLVPSAAELPSFELDHTVTPSPTNPLGVKGIGEAGTIASTPAVMNAVVDALSHLGVTDITMPASPERVWAAINESAIQKESQ